MDSLSKAISFIGGQSELARRIGVSQPQVWNWLKRGDRVPAEHCPAIERETAGQVRCEELRPDVAWDVLRSSTTKEAA